MNSSKRDKLLSDLYHKPDQRATYEVVKGLMDEVESLQQQLKIARTPPSQDMASHIVTYNDFQLMVSAAIRDYVDRALPLKLSLKDINVGHTPHVYVIEAFIGYCNTKLLLNKPIKFDYRR